MSEQTPEPTNDPAPETPQGDPADLGDAGKRALQAEREGRAAAEKREREAQAALATLTEQHTAATAELEQVRNAIPTTVAQALRSHVVALQGISQEDADLFLTSTDPDTLLKQAARLTERASAPLTPAPDPSQGPKGDPSPNSTGEAFADFIESKLQS